MLKKKVFPRYLHQPYLPQLPLLHTLDDVLDVLLHVELVRLGGALGLGHVGGQAGRGHFRLRGKTRLVFSIGNWKKKNFRMNINNGIYNYLYGIYC